MPYDRYGKIAYPCDKAHPMSPPRDYPIWIDELYELMFGKIKLREYNRKGQLQRSDRLNYFKRYRTPRP